MSTFINELPQYQQNQGLKPDIANQLMNELNEVSIKGDTLLPPRDIPSQNINIDEEAMPNYVPEGSKYIQPEPIRHRVSNGEKFDKIYDEIQTPILLSILFFLFQLPIFRNTMFRLFPFMFSKDGNANVQGYFGFSIFFGIFYYCINKILTLVNF